MSTQRKTGEEMPSRRRLVGRRALLRTGLGLAALSGRPGWALPAATEVRLADRGGFTRFVVDLSEDAGFRLFTLVNPNRVVVDLPEVSFADLARIKDRSEGLIADYRYGLFQPGNSRLVLDLAHPAAVRQAFVLPPADYGKWRLVIDLEKIGADAFHAGLGKIVTVGNPPAAQDVAAAPVELPAPDVPQGVVAGPSAPAGTPVPERKPGGMSGERIRIVLDPGHGGVDPGAIGVSGVKEKEITLMAARELREHLLATGRFDVTLTRDKDIFVRLRDRVRIARAAKADLFLSIHADSFTKASVKGLSVYTLSETASDREAAALAEKENKADLIAGIDLSHESRDVLNILIDLAQRESLNLAATLASRLVGELKRVVVLKRDTHRFAGFAVLKAPDIPSILIEMGYLSNREEERALRQRPYRTKLLGAVGKAVDTFFEEHRPGTRY